MFIHELGSDDLHESMATGERSAAREKLERIVLRLALFASLGFIAAICFK